MPEQSKSDDILVAEYSTLRDEINANSMVASQTVTVAFTAAIAFITFGLQSGSWAIFFAPVILLTILAIFVTSQYDSTVRIAAYIRHRFEEGAFSQLKWERGLNVMRGRLKRDRPTLNYVASLAVVFILLDLASCILSAYFFQRDYGSLLDRLAQLPASEPALLSTLFVFGWALLLVISLVAVLQMGRAFSPARFSYHYENWKQALTLIDQEAAPVEKSQSA